jgi:hypothetical protein
MQKKKPTETTQIDIVKVSFGALHFNLVGTTPLVINRLAEKARHELLLPALKKNAAGRATTLKHDPIQEFRSSLYRTAVNSTAARIYFPGSAFASAIADVAVDIPGSSRAQVERLTKVPEQYIPIYGTPKVYMAIVRTLGMNKTPDVRTRGLLPEWACAVEVRYVKGLITERSVTNLFAAAGVIGGMGDGRGKMGFGQFRLVEHNDKDFLRIVKTQGRAVQDKAIQAAEPYDAETEELLSWFKTELIEREKQGQDDPGVLTRSRRNHEEEVEGAEVE